MGTLRWNHRLGALVYWQGHRRRIIEAIGHNVIKFLTDFARLPVDDTTGDPTEWTTTVVELGAGTTTFAQGDASGGQLLITTAANDNDGGNYQLNGESFKFKTTNIIYFGAFGIKISDAAQSDFFVGLAITDTDILGGVTDRVGFQCLDGESDIKAMLEKDSTETLTASLGTLADATAVDLEFYWDGSKVEFFVNGVSKGKPAVTNLPDDEELRATIQFLNGAAGAETMSMDALRVVQIGR